MTPLLALHPHGALAEIARAALRGDDEASVVSTATTAAAAFLGCDEVLLRTVPGDGEDPRTLTAPVPALDGAGERSLVAVGPHAGAFGPQDAETLASVGLVLASALEQRRAAADLAHRAAHDGLTGLVNRQAFAARAARALASADAAHRVAVVLLDVDRFKDVNETYGHLAGDAVLVALAARLRSTLGDRGVLARFGGDEFAILASGIEGEGAAVTLADASLRSLDAPFQVTDRPLVLRASVGVVVSDGADRTADALLRDADIAMHRAKERGGSRCEVFEDPMRRRVVERVQLQADLRRALDRDEFRLHFQPIVSAAKQQVLGVEALVRWEHPELGVVPPSAFIPAAESSGLILSLGRFVLREACRQMARWLAAGSDLRYVSVNLSGRQLADPLLTVEVERILEQTGLPADRLALEITESVLMGETASPAAVLQQLESLGVRLLLDDFGTGCSSLNYLKRFPVQAIKVDRSFINGITEDATDRHILRAIVDLAGGLGIDVIAEGVETVEQAVCVRSLGCETLQGYLFSRPVPAAAIEPWLRTGLSHERLAPALATTVAPAERAPAAAAASEADEGPTVPLAEAAQALSVSTSTLRRWADAGRIRTLRTSGGHRRFPVAELQRLNRSASGDRPAVVRPVALPSGPLPALAELLRIAAAELGDASSRALYERPHPGWFAGEDGETEVRAWALAVASACETGALEHAVAATTRLLTRAHYAGASLLERHTFIERYGDVAVRALQQRGAAHAEIISARRLFVRLRQALLDEPMGR